MKEKAGTFEADQATKMMTRGTKMNNAEDGGSKTCQEIMTQIPLIVNIYRLLKIISLVFLRKPQSQDHQTGPVT